MPAGEKNTVSSPPWQMLMRPVALDGTGAFHEGEPTFNYEHKQSDLDEPCWSRTGWKTNQPVDASSEMPLGWLAIQSLSPGEFPPLGVPLPLSFYGAALLKKKKKHHLGPLSCRKLPKIPASPYRGLSTFISDAFGENDMAYWKCLRQSSVRWNKYYGPRALWLCLFWQDMHLLPGKAGGIHVLHFFAEPSFKQINYRRVYGCKDKVYT